MTGDNDDTAGQTRKKGGRRVGAGAPKGNKNGFRTGSATGNQRLQLAWQSLTPEQRELWRPIVKRAGAAFDVAWLEEVAAAETKVRLIKGSPAPGVSAPKTPQYTHTQRHTIKSNQTEGSQHLLRERELDVTKALVGWGFFGADAFVEVHSGALERLEKAIAEMRVLEDSAEPVFRNKAGAIRDMVHEALMVRVGNIRQCPYCGKRQAIMVRLLDGAEEQSS